MAADDDVPVIDLTPLLSLGVGEAPTPAVLAQAALAASGLHRFGLLVVRDPRASEADNSAFIDLMEAYFGQPEPVKMSDVRKELYYQVGSTPSGVELPRDHCDRMRAFKDADKPLSLCPPEKDPKWRAWMGFAYPASHPPTSSYPHPSPLPSTHAPSLLRNLPTRAGFFWRVGEPPAATAFPLLNAAPVVPPAFPQWGSVMDSWGSKLLAAADATAQLAALGFGLPRDAFSGRMAHGPHLLAPTASDFSRFGALGTVLAGFHADLNFITAHGRSRYPGLFVWTRAGKRIPVKIPAGCLLLQAGLQFQHLTGGHVLAGFHEVVVSAATVESIAAAASAGRSLWRISSTLFSHIASDVTLEPLAHFAGEEGAAAYPPVKAGDQVAAELAAINLGEGSTGSSAAR